MYREVQNQLRALCEDLLGGTSPRDHMSAGDLVFRDGQAPRIALIRGGAVRVFLRTETGRQMTVRYARPGDLIGVVPLLGGTRTWNAEAIVQTTLEVLTVDQIQEAATRHPELPWLIAENVAAWATEVARTIADSISQPMVARVARHLGEFAFDTPNGRAVAHVSHQRLADAVGTVREVISRQLRALRAEGVIETRPGQVIVVDEERLARIAATRSRRPI
jgi:CRP/FNR family cyclic AMP-dependent transcriptional regulator